MAIQYVGGATANTDASLSVTVSLTGLSGGLASSPAQGDFVIATLAQVGSIDRNLTVTTSGYTEAAEPYGNDTADANVLTAYKRMGASPDTDVTLTSEGGGGALVAVVSVWRGVDAVTPMDVAVTSASGGNTDRPNPAAITPVTAGTVIVVTGGSGTVNNVAGTPLAQAGAELSNFLSIAKKAAAADSTSLVASGSYHSWAAGAFDPVAFVGGGNAASDAWGSVTLALRPALTYTLDAATGSLTLTGGAATFVRDIVMAAGSGALTLAGGAADLARGFTMPADGGTLVFAGATVDFIADRLLSADGGALTLAGGNASLVFERVLMAEGGTLSFFARGLSTGWKRRPDFGRGGPGRPGYPQRGSSNRPRRDAYAVRGPHSWR
jgi:hypothetical protein